MTRKLTFNGIVQGIGFRPTAQRIAIDLDVKGQVKNTGGNVELIITSNSQALDSFVQRLVAMFDIKAYTNEIIEDIAFDDFRIIHSSRDNDTPFITPDLATCEECERELKDSINRRYQHPFISCINCGPRYTIINTLPYDRENITMSVFDMCDECKEEYTNPSDRRCHAQTIACRSCGPTTSMTIDEAIDILKNGEVLAIKDIGGYHLACDVYNSEAVDKIRAIKGRDTKPFAVMYSSIDEIEEQCFVNEKEKELLLSPARPIVLLEKKSSLPDNVCGDSEYIGAFLPCNPIQIMILEKCSPLVMTSANVSGEPIIIDDNKIKKLGVKTLSHDREILTPLDDSVLKIVNGKTQFIRRARGYTPLAIEIDNNANTDTLCMGGDLKSIFAFHKGKYVYLSQYFGDLENADVLEAYKSNIDRFAGLHFFKKDRIVADSHPRYFSSSIYNNDATIQHHKAHIASVIAEHRLKGNVLGFAFDGTGYGDDGAIWGSEVILYNGKGFDRREHLEYTKMLASDEVSKNADYALACYIGGNEIIDKAIKADINTVNSSSMGRLFDAVCSLLDIKHYNTYEGECACALERIAKSAKKEYHIEESFSPEEILAQIKNANAEVCEIALGFHMMICRLILNTALEYRRTHQIEQIALSGGVFNNKIILENTIKLLEENGFMAYTNELVPCGDGGIALGQAFISSLEE